MKQPKNGRLTERDRFYIRVLTALDEAGVPFLIGGAYALFRYAGIERDTKDLDVFLRRKDCAQALEAGKALGYKTCIEADHWIGKILDGDSLVDVIYSSGNGVCAVDEEWFAHAEPASILGRPVTLIPPEEMLWSKSFVQDRGRYDGADVAHLLRARADQMDWDRVLRRFGDDHWPVLLSQLVLFGYVYPSERTLVPAAVYEELIGRLLRSLEAPGREQLCRGTLFSFIDYLPDLRSGYADARLKPRGPLSQKQVRDWTLHLRRQH